MDAGVPGASTEAGAGGGAGAGGAGVTRSTKKAVSPKQEVGRPRCSE